MNIVRVALGLIIASIGFIAALVMLIIFFLFLPDNDGLVERLGFVVILGLIEAVIFAVTLYAFRMVRGRRPDPDRW